MKIYFQGLQFSSVCLKHSFTGGHIFECTSLFFLRCGSDWKWLHQICFVNSSLLSNCISCDCWQCMFRFLGSNPFNTPSFCEYWNYCLRKTTVDGIVYDCHSILLQRSEHFIIRHFWCSNVSGYFTLNIHVCSCSILQHEYTLLYPVISWKCYLEDRIHSKRRTIAL